MGSIIAPFLTDGEKLGWWLRRFCLNESRFVFSRLLSSVSCFTATSASSIFFLVMSRYLFRSIISIPWFSWSIDGSLNYAAVDCPFFCCARSCALYSFSFHPPGRNMFVECFTDKWPLRLRTISEMAILVGTTWINVLRGAVMRPWRMATFSGS